MEKCVGHVEMYEYRNLMCRRNVISGELLPENRA